MEKNKKMKIVISIVIFVIIIAIIVAITINYVKQEEEKQKETLQTFISLINNKEYENMYNNVSQNTKQNISQEDFIKRNKNIYEGIDAKNIEIEIKNLKDSQLTYNEDLYTSAGEINFQNNVTLTKEDNDYKLEWSSSFIFPDLKADGKVRVSNIKAKRGSIQDKNGYNLAVDGKALNIGIVPGKLNNTSKDTDIAKIAELLEVSKDTINEYLSASYVKDDTFVPIKKISKNSEIKDSLLAISGVMANDIDSRVYSLGEEAAHVIGYVQSINAEELEKNQGKGYTSTSLIGKSGLELSYEDTLRGVDGTEIYIEDIDGNKIKTLAKQDKKDGKDIKLTIDYKIQKQLYDQMKDDKGLFVVMQPQTGELLALISTPSYNSNDFALGMTTDKWNSLNNDSNKPLYNRFIQSYCPGSTFKPITGAIGLTTGKLDTNDTFSYSGKSWQKDSSWGDYYITTLTSYSGAKNMENALIHSDNIYFAQAALQIGKDVYSDGLNKAGFNEQIEFPLNIKKSQYLNDGEEFTQAKLANTGYGQGDLLINPIHMASMYSAFANNGNMIKPYIEYKENSKAEILKENVFSKDAANTIKDDLIQVVENKEGTANDAKVEGMTIAGKTGTAELKSSKDDTESGTLRMV